MTRAEALQQGKGALWVPEEVDDSDRKDVEYNATTGYSLPVSGSQSWEVFAWLRAQAVQARSTTPEQAARDAALAARYGVPTKQVWTGRTTRTQSTLVSG